ncbi:MAG: response regulator [Bacteroidetes bacterium]|nr:response regulator [Bacteroidota bacterium]
MKKTILCVDDEATILVSLKSQLKRNFGSDFGYEFAESPLEAMELIDELVDGGVKIILIVSDWLMPEMRGDDFLIDMHKKYPGIVKIMLTGQANKEAVERAQKEADLLACLQKPWDEQEFVALVREGIKLIQ